MQEQELFQQYELKGWQLSSHIYKIIGASVLINIIAFYSMAQANFLTGKTCDSPIASGICSVVDALYVATVLGDTDIRYRDEDYVKTELEDAEITMVNLTGEYPLEYPAGYFALANPEQQAQIIDQTMIPPTDMNGFPNPTMPGGSTDLMNTPPITPTRNNKTVKGILPDTPFGNNPTTRFKPEKQKNPTITNDSPGVLPGGNLTADTKTDKPEDEKKDENEIVEEVKVNKKVMVDYANIVKDKVKNEGVDLTKQFKVVVEGTLTKDGKFDKTIDKRTKAPKSQVTFTEGDEKMVEVARQALEAVGDSGWLGYLRNLGAEKVKITFVQDKDKIFAVIESEQKTSEKADSIASGLRLLISMTKNNVKLGEDETILLNGAQPPTSNGKMFILNFALPKKDVQEMIQRNLKKAAEANQNSTAQAENAEQKTSK